MGKSTTKNPGAASARGEATRNNVHGALPRDNADVYENPYLPDEHYEDGTVCVGCGAVYSNQHWTVDEHKRDALIGTGLGNEILCPGCRKISGRDPQGIVTLRGDYWRQHREEIVNLIRNEEQRGTNTNPLERIIDIRDEDGCLIIETTNVKLAQRIGAHVDKAHNGKVEYKW